MAYLLNLKKFLSRCFYYIFCLIIITSLQKSAYASQSTLTFSPTQITTSPNQTFNVNVNLDTQGNSIGGVDVIIHFDNTNLTLQTVSNRGNSLLKTVLPINQSLEFDSAGLVNLANTTGKIQIGYAAYDLDTNTVNAGFNGLQSPLFTLSFQTKSTAVTNIAPIRFDYIQAGSTIDTNIIKMPINGVVEEVFQMPSSQVTINGFSPTNTPAPACEKRNQGDANCDNIIDLLDFNIWRTEYISGSSTRADFNGSGGVDLLDFNIWRITYTS